MSEPGRFENDAARDWVAEFRTYTDDGPNADTLSTTESDYRSQSKFDEILLRYYLYPIPVIVVPQRDHSKYEPDTLLGWIYIGNCNTPVLKNFPGADIVAKVSKSK